jgi:hypothetical protein
MSRRLLVRHAFCAGVNSAGMTDKDNTERAKNTGKRKVKEIRLSYLMSRLKFHRELEFTSKVFVYQPDRPLN